MTHVEIKKQIKPHFDNATIMIYENEQFNHINIVVVTNTEQCRFIYHDKVLVIISGEAHILDIKFMEGLFR